MITKERAYEIVGEFKDELLTVMPDDLLAIYLIGSLGGGYYRPGQSDIDTVIIVRDQANITQEQMDEIAETYQKKYDVPKGFGSVMIFEKELFPPYLKSEIEEFEFSIEIARLKVQGILFYGAYNLDQVPMPTKEDLIKDAKIMEQWFDSAFGYPMHDKLQITGCINCILGTMRRKLMIEDGVFEFNKFKTIDAYLSHQPDIVEQDIFNRISQYLNGVALEEADLILLRRFGTKLADHYNEKLLGIKR